MFATVQCQKPEPVGASGSKQVTAKLFVPSGAPDHFRWGERLPSAKTCASGRNPPSVKLSDVTMKVLIGPRCVGAILTRERACGR